MFLKDLFTECLSLHPPPAYYTDRKNTHIHKQALSLSPFSSPSLSLSVTNTNTHTHTYAAISILAITSSRVLLFGRVTVIEVAPLGAVHSGPLSAVSCCCFFLKWVVFWLLCCFFPLSYRSVSCWLYLHVSLEN